MAHLWHRKILAKLPEELVRRDYLDLEARQQQMKVRGKLLRQPQAHLAAREEDINGAIVRALFVGAHTPHQLDAQAVGRHRIVVLHGLSNTVERARDVIDVRANSILNWPRQRQHKVVFREAC